MPTADWKRLGPMLVRRRIELDPRYSNRKLFTSERGINYRIVQDLEAGRRGNYEPATLTAAELAYSLAAGNLARAAEGDDLEPLPAAARTELPGPVAAEPAGDAASLMFPDDPAAAAIWRAHEPVEWREALIAEMRADPTLAAIWRLPEPEAHKKALTAELRRLRTGGSQGARSADEGIA